MNWTEKLLGLFRNEESGPEIRGPIALTGDLHLPKGGRFEAKLKGKLSSRLTLLVGPASEIEGDLRVENCQIQGQCNGRIDASGSIRVDSAGTYSGKLVARSLRVEPGAEFQSDVSIEPSPVFEQTPEEFMQPLADPREINPPAA